MSATGESFARAYLAEVARIVAAIDPERLERMAEIIAAVREDGGRLFFLGVGGGAGNATHAVNDFRKIAGIESYTPTDNVSELTARINDDGWNGVFERWLEVSRLSEKDAIFVFSVGGGDAERNVSANIVTALKLAQRRRAKILGVVGRDGGYVAKAADACVVVPTVNPATVTAHTEAFQAVLWHLLVSHPRIKANEMKWESIR